MNSQTKKALAPATAKAAMNNKKTFILAGKDLFPVLFLLAYIVVDFVPRLSAADVMGSQWLYLAFIDLLSIVYIARNKRVNYAEAIVRVSKSALTILYFSLFILSGISILVALNKIESLVCYARFVVSLIAYFNMAVLLYQRLHLFRWFVPVLSVILLLQASNVLVDFFKNLGEDDLNTHILGIQGNAGNKNILAASMVIKLPFVFYGIYTFKTTGRLFNALVFLLAGTAIAILNARASFLSFLFITASFILFCLLENWKINRKEAFMKTGLVVFTFSLVLLLSSFLFKNALSLQERESAYGTIGQRLSTISFSKEGSDYRVLQWNSALDYIQHHPLMGAGYGNWKLASIPYEQNFTNDFLVTYHVHNDFLETAAETGIAGGMLLLGLFICAAFYVFKIVYPVKKDGINHIAVFALLSLAVYFTDAMFNFPQERPIMQFFLAFLLAILLNTYLQRKNEGIPTGARKPGAWFTALGLLLLLPALWLNYSTYQSLRAQDTINQDVLLYKPSQTFEQVKEELPSIPNLNAFCFAVDAIKAKYLYAEKKYDAALALLDKSKKANPYLPYDDFLKTQIFIDRNQLDSAFFYARQGYAKRPRSQANYLALTLICYQLKDTITLNRAFKTMISHRNEAWVWSDYLAIWYNLTHDLNTTKVLLDSAVKQFPDDKDLRMKKSSLFPDQEAEALAQKGIEAFNKNDYPAAMENFIRASERAPGNYVHWENIGVCFYMQNNFQKALSYFEKAIQLQTSVDGKSEYLKGMCLVRLGNQPEACRFLKLAAAKNYPDARAQLAISCP